MHRTAIDGRERDGADDIHQETMAAEDTKMKIKCQNVSTINRKKPNLRNFRDIKTLT